jgi:hypothetical protein
MRLVPLFLGAKMAPMEKLRDGRGTDLGWLPFGGDMQQPTKRWCRWGGAMRTGGMRGEDVYPSFRAAVRATNKKIERAMGPCNSMDPAA